MTKISDLENVELIHEHGLDYNKNEIYIMSEEAYVSAIGVEDTTEPGVEFLMAKKFIKNLNILANKTDESITIHLKSCGGNWEDGMAMFDAIKACPNNIIMVNYAEARSMSSIIFLAGNELWIHNHGKFMFHEGTVHTGGTTKQLRTEYEETLKSSEQMIDIYTDHLFGKPHWKEKSKAQIKKWLNNQMNKHEEVYLSAEEAVDIGFADKIIDYY